MFVQKVPHIKDQFLTQERASMELESGQIAVGWYTNEQDSQSVVHSHPYYELVLPLVGSNVRYSVDGNIYDINLGEMIIFPARCYHAGMFNITDKISERLIAQINAELWQEALLASGLVAPTWLGQLVILDADAVTAWDLRGLFERMAQTAYLHGSTQHMVQRCELVELLLLMDQIVAERRAAPPSATSALVAKAVAFLQANYTDPNLTVGSLAKYTYTSREHLSRAFKTYTMESVHGYLTNLRMQHCRCAIAAGASVLDACNASGFTNYTSFFENFPQFIRHYAVRISQPAAAYAGAGSLYPINNVSRPISSLGQLFSQINLKKAQKQAHQSQSSFQSVLGFDEPLFKATPHNSRLTA
jgi:AraC-like DNA-binding protein